MTVWGVTPTGFRRKTFDEIAQSLVDAVHAVPFCSRLELTRDTFLGNVVFVVAAAIAELWLVLQALYSAFDPDGATGQPLDNLSALTGTRRLGATPTLIPRTTVNLDLGTYPAHSLVASIAGHPELRFYNRDAIVNTFGTTDIDTTFLCETVGPVVVVIGTLTVIASPVTGWNYVQNTFDAVTGLNTETDSELRARRERELAAEGGSTIDAIIADMQKDSRIIRCYVFENTSDTPQTISGTLMPGHSIEAVVYDGTADGSGLTDQEIADRYWKTAPGGINTVGGITETVTALDGQDHPISFSRPTAVDVFVSVTVVTTTGWDAGTSPAALKAAIVEYAQAHYTVGSEVYRAFLYTPVTAFPGVLNVTGLLVGLSFPGSTSDLALTNRQIARFVSANINVNGA